tara:strand:+ start:4163 stop:5413 length:1251 start_codon:yes stop_codon:yes gene_type:complete
MTIKRTALQKMSTAVGSLLLSNDRSIEGSAFYGWLAAQLSRRVDNSIDTVALSYNYHAMEPELIINEDFVDNLTVAELKGVIIHEMLHLAHRHMHRRGPKDPKRFNIAADMAVNHIINSSVAWNGNSNIRLPENHIEPIPNAESTATEWFYNQLVPPEEGNDGGDGGGGGYTYVQGGGGSAGNMPDDSHDQWASFNDLPPENFDAQVLGMVNEASAAAGSMPGAIHGAISGLLNPKVSWKHFLRTFVGTNTKVGTIHTWSKPSRRIPPIVDECGTIRPVTQGRRYVRSGTLGVIMDTSGSVPDPMLKQFMTEIDTINKSHAVWVAEVDTEVNDLYLYNSRDYKIQGKKITGRGGTDMNPGLELMNKHKDIEMIVILTDGYLFNRPLVQQKPELWCITPGGSTSYIDDRKHVVMKDN